MKLALNSKYLVNLSNSQLICKLLSIVFIQLSLVTKKTSKKICLFATARPSVP